MFSRDIPHEVLNYRLDLGAISFVPRDAQLLATEILKDELTLVVHPKHLLARKREVDVAELGEETLDRKSTRLNSSHSQISYAVFCLKKKKLRAYSLSYS